MVPRLSPLLTPQPRQEGRSDRLKRLLRIRHDRLVTADGTRVASLFSSNTAASTLLDFSRAGVDWCRQAREISRLGTRGGQSGGLSGGRPCCECLQFEKRDLAVDHSANGPLRRRDDPPRTMFRT